MSTKAVLQFTGKVRPGCDKFARELTLPRRNELPVPIQDWPEVPCQGTLNIQIDAGGFPSEFLRRFSSANVQHFDSRRFAPEAELPWNAIGGNTLPPIPGKPDRGNAQVWRATLSGREHRMEQLCWVLRRIGSGLKQDLELVAGINLRAALELSNGSAVDVYMHGAWRDG